MIIDAHLHFSKIKKFTHTAKTVSKVSYSLAGLAAEMKQNRVVAAVGMGLQETKAALFPDKTIPTPMLLDLDENPKSLYACPGINPYKLNKKSLSSLELLLKNPKTVGIKLYSGYYHFHLFDKVYGPVYELAAKYKMPIVSHGGGTYSHLGLYRYSHPLDVEEAAYQFPKINFIIAHLGNPWIYETAELVYMKPNIFADLSGLIVADSKGVKETASEKVFTERYRSAVITCGAYEKLLYGSDWPLAPMKAYIAFIEKLIPEKHKHKVFYKNALNVFPRLKIQS
ncbi:MAG: amidohydrolase family protein [bacterium]